MSQDRHPPMLMRPGEILTLKRAAHHAGLSQTTIRRVCKQHEISRKLTPRSPLQISAPALEMVLHGDLETLEIFRTGDRQDPNVVHYLKHLGLKD